jgi:hypothetical protein
LHSVTQSDLRALRGEFSREMAGLRHEIWKREAERELKIQKAKTEAIWRRGRRICVAALLLNIVAEAGVLYWFAKLLGH